MMNTLFRVSVAGLAVIASLSAQPVPDGDLDGLSATIEQTTNSTVLGRSFSWTVSEHDLVSTPGWTEVENREPPLSVSAAVAFAKADLVSYLPEVTEWQLVGVRLERLGWQGKWFYVVEWKSARHHRGDSLEIPVLMSGQTIRLS